MDAVSPKSAVVPFSLKDTPSLIERVWPAQKISVETKREFDAHGAQTLTALGSYWKGRKRLIYIRACILGALLPATEDPEADLKVFEQLMCIDDRAFLSREIKAKPAEIARLAIEAGALKEEELSSYFEIRGKSDPAADDYKTALREGGLTWAADPAAIETLRLAAYSRWSYEDKVARSLRPEELSDDVYADIWAGVNRHLGTRACSIQQLVEQLGIMRFGHKPKIADTFCGAGSIPFEAARVGCDIYASDLNPIACMLTWGAIHLVGGGDRLKSQLVAAQKRVADAVDEQLTKLGVEHDSEGNRAKAYLYCLEARCPETGWIVPLLPSLVVSKIKKAIVRLRPNESEKRLEVEIVSGVSAEELEAAKRGTVQERALVYELKGRTYRTPIASIRGDYRKNGEIGNNLRRWDKGDVVPKSDDIFGESLYCVQWISADSVSKGRQETFFATPTDEDRVREAKVLSVVKKNLASWQSSGFVPDMEIQTGIETARLLRERGWTYWHHLYCARQLLIAALVAEEIEKIKDPEVRACLSFDRTFLADKSSRLSHWRLGAPGRDGRAPSADGVENVFYNQALNPFYNFGARGFSGLRIGENVTYKYCSIGTNSEVKTERADRMDVPADIFVTDPPYADAVNYHEITEFFIAWLRKNPASPFREWIWDSRRPLAIKGNGDEFRKAMVDAYRAATNHMPDNGLQIVMFTHQDGRVWADMAQIFWGAGLQVVSAWYVATETTSETKKGGYIQGTVTLVLRKRVAREVGYKDEIVQEVKAEVADQIDTLIGLNQQLKGHGRIENLFEDADLQMAGYAAALRVLTKYEKIDGIDMTMEALRPRRIGEKNLVGEIIDFAVQIANEHMVPEQMAPRLWEGLSGAERFYFKMMDIETTSLRKLDNYQNFAKAFRVDDYGSLMGSLEPNKARLKAAREFKKSGFEIPEFGPSVTRVILYAIYELESEAEGDEVLSHLRDMLPSYHSKRDDVAAIAEYIARKREKVDETESRAARILHGLIRNERLG
ncbi:putative DNA methylase [Bradyrhizobium sp. USDA 4341]